MALTADLANLSEAWLLPGALATIMFAIGLELRPEVFLSEAARKRPLLAGLIGMALLVPTVGTLMGVYLSPTPAVMVGIILLATCPVGILAPMVTDLCRGSAPVAITLTALVSGLYVLAAPFIAHQAVQAAFGVSKVIDAPTGQLFIKVMMVTVAPVTLGLLVRGLAPQVAAKARAIKSVMSAVLLAVFAVIVLRRWRELAETLGAITALVLLLNLVSLAIALLMARLFRLRGPDASAVIICHVMRQEGTAIFIAVSVLGLPEIALPLIINTLVGMIVCALLFPALRSQRRRISRPV